MNAAYKLSLLLATTLVLFVSDSEAQFQHVNYNFSSLGPAHESGELELDESRSAANGYGVWGSNDMPGGQYGWVLLSNAVSNKDLSDPSKIIPSGQVQAGLFQQAPVIRESLKIVANLRGAVRYVWLNQSKTGFIIQGFDDGQIRMGEIDVKFTHFPNPVNHRFLVDPDGTTPTIHQFPLVVPFIDALGTHLPLGLDEIVEPILLDQFDVAIDGKNLYIVWNKVIPDDLNWEIWSVTVDLATGDKSNVNYVMKGRRPTVAADVRNIPENPTYDVACLWNAPFLPLGVYAEVRTRLFHEGLGKNVFSLHDEVRCDGQTIGYGSVTRARILCGSVANAPTTAKGVYILRRSLDLGDEKYHELLFHRIRYDHIIGENSPAISASHVDGILNNLRPAPMVGQWGVQDEPIVAFANPYDGEASPNYAEFHCNYRMRGVVENGQFTNCMVRADHNGCNGRPDTRTPVDRKLNGAVWEWLDIENPFLYHTACVNQMGIHVYQQVTTGGGGRYYSRDKRSFDEPIEENTLVTYDCYVKDGITHGGTVGATVKSGKTVTLWTDPISGITSTTSGLYINTNAHGRSWHNAQLRFVGAGVRMDVGPLNGDGATFVTFPNCEIHFPEETGQNNVLNFNRSSVWEYYSVPGKTDESDRNETASIFYGRGLVRLNNDCMKVASPYFNEPPDFLLFEPTLKVHGGAKFSTSTHVRFEAETSTIKLLREPSVLPATIYTGNQSDDVNDDAYGLLNFSGNVSLTESFIESVIAASDNVEYLIVRPKFKLAQTITGDQFTAFKCKFENIGGGIAVIRFRDNHHEIDPITSESKVSYYRSSWFEKGRIIANEIYFENPYEDIRLELVTFDQIRNRGIYGWAHDVGSYNNDYSHVIIDNCRFEEFSFDDKVGIHLSGFEDNSSFKDVRVQNNWFIHSQPTGRTVRAAIDLENVSAAVLRNTAVSNGYKNLLINSGTLDSRSNSFICDNTLRFAINGGEGAGLTTKFWSGYAKLNRIGYNDIGHRAQEEDNSGILFSRYHQNYETGLLMSHPSTTIDISGVHNGSINYAAYDTLDGNNTNVGSTPRSGQIYINGSTLILGTSSDNPSIYGANGQNTFMVPLNGMRYIVNAATTSVPIGGINENFWGFGTLGSYTPVSGSSIAASPGSYFGNVSIAFDGTEPAVELTPIARPFSVSCGQGFDPQFSPPPIREETAYSAMTDDTNICEDLFERVRQMNLAGQYRQSNDSGRYFIENCANTPRSFRGFTQIGSGVQFMSDSPDRWYELRDWVKKVLFLNTSDPQYYCGGVRLLFMSFQHFDPIKGNDHNGMVALIDYMVTSGKCPDDTATYRLERLRVRNLQHQIWADTVKDSLATPLDTAMVTLEDIGLEWVRGQSHVASEPAPTGHGLISFRARENPYRRETVLEYEIDMDLRVRIEIFDVLGRRVLGDDIGLLTPKGRHSFKLPADLPSGTLMARISSGNGEVRTIQLRKLE
jgi:hypothetical protein